MADYNVQMKQFNGTSFDNILPYASQALTLAGGGDATEIIAQARAGLSQIATGSYVGNGVYTSPTQINVGFKPKLIFIGYGYNVYSSANPNFPVEARYKFVNGVAQPYTSFQALTIGVGDVGHNMFTGIMIPVGDIPIMIDSGRYQDVSHHNILTVSESNGLVSIKQDSYVCSDAYPTTLDYRAAEYQFNKQGTTYYYTAIG